MQLWKLFWNEIPSCYAPSTNVGALRDATVSLSVRLSVVCFSVHAPSSKAVHFGAMVTTEQQPHVKPSGQQGLMATTRSDRNLLKA